MTQADIATKIAAAREYLSVHREEARYRDSAATAVVEDGLRVRTTGSDGEAVVTDMSTGIGGGASAPSPGWLFRAADASCIATLIAMRAAEEAVTLERLEVTVDSESDDWGILGIDEAVPAGAARHARPRSGGRGRHRRGPAPRHRRLGRGPLPRLRRRQAGCPGRCAGRGRLSV